MSQTEKNGLRLFKEGDGRLREYLVGDDGTVLIDEIISPQDGLIDFMERPLKAYHEKIRALEDHALFQESLDISLDDFTDLVNLAFATAEELRDDFPAAYYFMNRRWWTRFLTKTMAAPVICSTPEQRF